MATLTKGTTFASGDVVTPAKLNALVDQATVSGIVNSDISASADIDGSKLANGSIATAKIADANITTNKLANGSVTADKIASGAIPSAIPAGAVLPFAQNTAPSGWLIANGDVVPNGTGTVQGITANFASLFSAVGTVFGAAGTLPDLRGIFIRGSNSQTINGTTYSGTFGQKQNDELISHKHLLFADSLSVEGSKVSSSQQSAWSSNNDGREDYAIGGVTNNATLGNSSSVGGTETRPANIALLYCIKF